MSIDWFRDLVISIFGLVATGVLIFVAVLAYFLYRRARSVLDSAKVISKTTQGIFSYVGDEVAKPLIEAAALIHGIRQGIGVINKLFKRRRGK